MTIDKQMKRTLHIGSHVSCKGSNIRVCRLNGWVNISEPSIAVMFCASNFHRAGVVVMHY